MSELIKAVEHIGETFDIFKKTHDDRLDKFEKRLEGLQERIETTEAQADRPRAGGTDSKGFSRDEHEHKDLFCEWLRRPTDGHTRRRLDDAQHELRDKAGRKAVTIASDSAGGYAVPTIIDSLIEQRVNLLNPFRSLVRVVQVGSRDWKALVSSNDLSSGWVGEGGTRSETTTSRLFERAPTFGTIYSYPKASEESMQDIFFDVTSWLVEEAADGFAAAEATAIVSGDGSNKPSGLTKETPVSTDDDASPERDPGVLQFLTVSGSPQSITADDLIEMSLSIKERYTLDPNAVAWVMRRSTAAVVRKLKDPTSGLYLWQPSLQAGTPDMLLGYPVRLTDAMAAVSGDAFPIAFGNWRRGYLLCDRVGTMQITHDANITTPGQHKFYIRKVVGGIVYNHEAIKLLKIAD